MVREIAEKLTFPQQAVEIAGKVFDEVTASEEGNDALAMAMDAFFGGKEYAPFLEELAQTANCHRFTMDMVFLLICSDSLHDIYYIKEFPEELFWENMMELKKKLTECEAEHQIQGIDCIEQMRNYMISCASR